MARIVAKLTGGPRDGERVSVDAYQQEVATEARDDDGNRVGRYVKDDQTLRPAEPEDVEGFDGHGVEQAADFHYQEA